MSFTFTPARRQKIGLLLALAGASGSGKTFSALRLAKGLANGTGKIAVIDTEAGRALHYADRFDFLHGDMEPPFTPERYVEAIRAAQDAGATVIVIDSMSHEWNGEGGCADIQAQIAIKMATDRTTGEVDQWRVDQMTAPAWKEPKIRHKRMMSRLLQSRAHLIFCLRAEEKVEFVKEAYTDNRGKARERTKVVPAGFMPICEKGFMFEMTGSLTLHPESPGLARHDMPRKLSEALQGIFPDRQPITEATGTQLRAWAETGAERALRDVPDEVEPENRQRDAADRLLRRLEACTSVRQVMALTDDPQIRKWRDNRRSDNAILTEEVDQAFREKVSVLQDGDDIGADVGALESAA